MEYLMGKKTDNEENLKRYQERLAKLEQEGNLVPSPDLPINLLIEKLCEEGFKLLEEEAKQTKPAPIKDETSKMHRSLATNHKNPYVRARQIVLDKLPEWRRKEIETMEKLGNTDNKFYKDFVAEVMKIGDALPNN